MKRAIDILNGVLLEECTPVSAEELREICNLPEQALREMIDEGLIQPQGASREEWTFSGTQLRRAREGARLLRDLELNMAGAALALDLLEEIRELRRRVASLEHQLGLRR